MYQNRGKRGPPPSIQHRGINRSDDDGDTKGDNSTHDDSPENGINVNEHRRKWGPTTNKTVTMVSDTNKKGNNVYQTRGKGGPTTIKPTPRNQPQ